MGRYYFESRTVIITGGAGDIGSEIARHLYARGMNIMIADINRFAAESLVKELGENAMSFVGDLTDEDDMERLLDQTVNLFGSLDVLINGLAMSSAERFHNRSIESIRKEIEINLVAPCVLTRMAVPYLQKSDDPRVITITSLGAIQPLRETPIYSSTKFGLRGAMMSFALDKELHGITVSTVAPTATDTQMLRQEALDNGNVLNFIDTPQTPDAVAKCFVRVLENPKLEAYPKVSDSVLCRIGMLFPSLQLKFLKYFEARGRKGMKKYIDDLRKRGLIEEVNGKLKLAHRADRDGAKTTVSPGSE